MVLMGKMVNLLCILVYSLNTNQLYENRTCFHVGIRLGKNEKIL